LNYRRTLKEEVNNAVKDRRLNQFKVDNKGGACNSGELDYPALKPKQTNKPRLAWVGVEAASSNLQNFQETDHLGELVTQMKMVLEIRFNSLSVDIDHQQQQVELTSELPPPIPLNRTTNQTAITSINK
ncbi:unnamed protein product, partial [Rotaria sp. Silwood2]